MSNNSALTKPRFPVGATYTGPGPVYLLPSLIGQNNHDPRSKHARSPAFHFGLRWKTDSELAGSPGPLYVDSKFCRKGRYTAPAFTMSGRKKAESALKQPGPSDYVCVNPTALAGKRRTPAFTFGVSRRENDADRYPGPNQYFFEIGQNPQYSKLSRAPRCTIMSRHSIGGYITADLKAPGPGAYNIDLRTYKRNSPAYTMIGRHAVNGSRSKSPGPSSYSTDRALTSSALRQAPKYSFGIRHSPYEATFVKDVVD